MNSTLRTRIAPTPSGYLHLGNIANFLFVEKLALAAGGRLILRIDDCDSTRTRPEFVEHIFTVLRWLGIQWQEGPCDAADFRKNFSQIARKEHYFLQLKNIGHLTYACECSRKSLESAPCRCREKNLTMQRGVHTMRLRIQNQVLAAEFGDVVLWRKDDGPAYQWASVVDDLEQQVNLIVRGEDLLSSSELQKHIAALLAPEGFRAVRFVHHPLLPGEGGQKLSKSQQAPSVTEWIKGGRTGDDIRRHLAPVLEGWEIP